MWTACALRDRSETGVIGFIDATILLELVEDCGGSEHQAQARGTAISKPSRTDMIGSCRRELPS
jgi:hypothetical protein